MQEELFGLEDDGLEDEDEDEAPGGGATGGARAGDRARGDARPGGRDEAPQEQADDQVGHGCWVDGKHRRCSVSASEPRFKASQPALAFAWRSFFGCSNRPGCLQQLTALLAAAPGTAVFR